MNSNNKIVGRVEVYSVPKGQEPVRGIDTPLVMKEYTIPVSVGLNEIQNDLKSFCVQALGKSRVDKSPVAPILNSGDLRVGGIYKVVGDSVTFDDIGGSGVTYTKDSLFVAEARHYTGTGTCVPVFENYNLADNLFGLQGYLTEDFDGFGGIGFGDAIRPEEAFITTVNGIQSNAIDFKGIYSVTSGRDFHGYLHLGVDYKHDNISFNKTYARFPVMQEYVSANRDFIVYWIVQFNN